VSPRGERITPDTPGWRALRHRVETVVTNALLAAHAPF
jgi:hypothetical protein